MQSCRGDYRAHILVNVYTVMQRKGLNSPYFHHSVHERGFRSIIWNFFALGGATLWGVEYPCVGLRANRAGAEVRSHTATSSRTCRGSLGFGHQHRLRAGPPLRILLRARGQSGHSKFRVGGK